MTAYHDEDENELAAPMTMTSDTQRSELAEWLRDEKRAAQQMSARYKLGSKDRDAWSAKAEKFRDAAHAVEIPIIKSDIRQIIFDALDLSEDLRIECTADVVNALQSAGFAPTPPKVGSGELDAAWRSALDFALWALRKHGYLECASALAEFSLALAAPVDHPEVVGETLAEVEARVMQEYRWGNLTSLGVANHLRRGGFRIEIAQAKANALQPSDSPALEVGVAEALHLTAYEIQVLLGCSISGCNMAPDRVFSLPMAWHRLHAAGLIDRTDGLAIITEKGQTAIAALRAALAIPATEDGK